MKIYHPIIEHYEKCLSEHGDNHRGVDWPNKTEASKRYEVMLQVVKSSKEVSLLDFGCGASHLYEFLQQHNINRIQYSGLDISQDFIDLSKKKFPLNTYYCLDILDSHVTIPQFDYLVLNGLFTEKLVLSFEQMWGYFTKVLELVFAKVNIGIAFNVMSKQVDWERDDLFHVPLDALASFLCERLSRNFVIRNDYGLYEYTVYVYKKG